MNTLNLQNNQSFDLASIPFSEALHFQHIVADKLCQGCRLIALTPLDAKCAEKLIAVLAEPATSSLHLIGGLFNRDKLELESFANTFPHTNYLECELAENYGYLPLNHPMLRPVRKQDCILEKKPYQFFKLAGSEVHEVAVGPIHAGVIEPGHFRFQCHGENVYNLEINLGYQHRGVEALFLKTGPKERITLAESIAGDTVIGHALAHCSALESLTETQPGLRAQVIRAIAEELERVAMHLSGLGGIANDVGFALAASAYGRLRTLAINSLALLCGSRFGRGLLVYGGVRYDFNEKIIEDICSNLQVIKNDVEAINKYLFSSTGAFIRFENTGTVTKELADQLGLTGPIARSCGLDLDIRIQFPYGAYRFSPIPSHSLASGNVYARARLRCLEIDESLKFITEQLALLPAGEVKTDPSGVATEKGVISLTEGWRGEIVHLVFTDKNGDIALYKIKDPSFNNWYGLSLALRNTGISDFPLCNKSFDLSYAGHDL